MVRTELRGLFVSPSRHVRLLRILAHAGAGKLSATGAPSTSLRSPSPRIARVGVHPRTCSESLPARTHEAAAEPAEEQAGSAKDAPSPVRSSRARYTDACALTVRLQILLESGSEHRLAARGARLQRAVYAFAVKHQAKARSRRHDRSAGHPRVQEGAQVASHRPFHPGKPTRLPHSAASS